MSENGGVSEHLAPVEDAPLRSELAAITSQVSEMVSILQMMQLNSQVAHSAHVLIAREIAAKAQADNSYDPNETYDTLIDPYPRTKRELIVFAEETADFLF